MKVSLFSPKYERKRADFGTYFIQKSIVLGVITYVLSVIFAFIGYVYRWVKKSQEKLKTILPPYKLGVSFCEKRLLPSMLKYLEPTRRQSLSRKLTPVIMRPSKNKELDFILNRYQSINALLKYIFPLTLALVVFLTGRFFLFLESAVTIPGFLFYIILLLGLGIWSIFWWGILDRIKNRQLEWQKYKDEDRVVSQIQFYARTAGDKLVSSILSNIKELQQFQKEEIEKTKDIIIQHEQLNTKTMQLFEEMLEKSNKKRERRENTRQWIFLFLGAILGVGVDRVLGLIWPVGYSQKPNTNC